MNNKRKRITVLVLCPSPKGTAATQRLKYEQYVGMLEKEGYRFTISNFQSQRCWKIIYQPGRTLEKIFWYCMGYLRRGLDLLRAPFYDIVYISLWGTPIGRPYYEHLLLLLNNNIIYDIDDMMFIKTVSHVKLNFFQRLKGSVKPQTLMKYSKFVIVCTPRLQEIAMELNRYQNVMDISSTFNTDRFVPVQQYQQHEVTTIGWTGTHSTLPFLDSLQPVLAAVSRQRRIKLLVIANKEYVMKDVPTEYIPWTEEREVQDLHRFEIGLYPIPANEWSLGKSSLKALTYMAIAIPVVATAYGTNFRVMQDGVEGFLALEPEEWIKKIIMLIDDCELRRRMGLAGRKNVEASYSLQANIPKYIRAFQTVMEETR